MNSLVLMAGVVCFTSIAAVVLFTAPHSRPFTTLAGGVVVFLVVYSGVSIGACCWCLLRDRAWDPATAPGVVSPPGSGSAEYNEALGVATEHSLTWRTVGKELAMAATLGMVLIWRYVGRRAA
jgi:hypothetical protein